MLSFNEKIVRNLKRSPMRLTVSEWEKLLHIKNRAAKVKAARDAGNKSVSMSGKEAKFVAALLGDSEPSLGKYTDYVFGNIDYAYTKYAVRPLSKDRHVVLGFSIDNVWMNEFNMPCVKLADASEDADTDNAVFTIVEESGASVINLDTKDGNSEDLKENNKTADQIAYQGLYVVNEDKEIVARFIPMIHGASATRGGKWTLISSKEKSIDPNELLHADDDLHIAMYKKFIGRADSTKQLVEELMELKVLSSDYRAKMAKVLARLCVCTSGTIRIAKVVSWAEELLSNANMLFFEDIIENAEIDVPVTVYDCDADEGKREKKTTRKESAWNGGGAADLIYAIPVTVAMGEITDAEGLWFKEIYKENDKSVEKSLAKLTDEEYEKFETILYKLKKNGQFRIKQDGEKGLLSFVCMVDFLEWYKNTDERVYNALSKYDVWLPKELVKFNTGAGFENLEICAVEGNVKTATMLNIQFAECLFTDLRPHAEVYFKMLERVCCKDTELAAQAALSLLGIVGEHMANPDEDSDTETAFSLAERITTNHRLVQEPGTREKIFKLTKKFFMGLGIAKLPIVGGMYTFGSVDLAGFIDITFKCKQKNPDALKSGEVYAGGYEGYFLMQKNPVTHTSEAQIAMAVKSKLYKYWTNSIVFNAYDGHAFKMSNSDHDGDQFSGIKDVDEMTHQIITDFLANKGDTYVCEAAHLFDKEDDGYEVLDTDEKFMAKYRKFIVATRNGSKVGILNNAYECIVSLEQHLTVIIKEAKAKGAKINFVPHTPKENGYPVAYVYDEKNNVIETASVIKSYDGKGLPNFLIDGKHEVSDVEGLLNHVLYMKNVATAAVQKEVDSAKDTGMSVSLKVIEWLTIASTPYHMLDRKVFKGKVTEEEADKFREENDYAYRMKLEKRSPYYVSASNVGNLNAYVTKRLREIGMFNPLIMGNVMTANTRNFGTDLFELLTDEERNQVKVVMQSVNAIKRDYNLAIGDLFDTTKQPKEGETVGTITERTLGYVTELARNPSESMFGKGIIPKEQEISLKSVAAAMFMSVELCKDVNIRYDASTKTPTGFSGYRFPWLLEGCINSIFARNSSTAMIAVPVDGKYYGKILRFSNGFLRDEDGNIVAKLPDNHDESDYYVPTRNVCGETVVFVKPVGTHKVSKNPPPQEVYVEGVYLKGSEKRQIKTRQTWGDMRRNGQDILVDFVIYGGNVCIREANEDTNMVVARIYHQEKDWGRTFTLLDMVGHRYKITPKPSKPTAKGLNLVFSLVK